MQENSCQASRERGLESAATRGLFAVLLVLAVIFSLLRLPLWATVLAAGLLTVAVFEHSKENLRLTPFLLGAAAPIVPSLGAGALLALLLSYILSLIAFRRVPKLRWAWPIVTLFVAWWLAEVACELDPKSWRLVYEGFDGPGERGFANIRQWLAVSPPTYLMTLQVISRYLAMLVLFTHFSEDNEARNRAIYGVLVALPFAAAVALLSFHGRFPITLPNQTHFWTVQGRITSTFSDPNAFGMFCMLCLPLVISRLSCPKLPYWRFLFGALLVASLASALLSGSRSFIVGLVLYGVVAFASCNLRASVLALGSGALCLLLWNALLVAAPDVLPGALAHLPVGLSRILSTISWPTASEALFSRNVFFKAALRMWMDNPVSGVGVGHFRDLVPLYLKATGSEVGAWVDNANSWYLQTLTETGVLGAGAFALAFIQLRWTSEAKHVRWAILVFAILLIVGPHVEFDEVSLLFALLAAMCLAPSPRPDRPAARMRFGVLLLLAIALVTSREYLWDTGFYGFEREGESIFRWSGRKAAGTVPCDSASHSAELDIRPVVPGPMSEGFILRVLSGGIEAYHGRLTPTANTGRLRVPVGCPGNSDVAEYEIEVYNAWTPRKFGLGADSRLLGVRVFSLPAWASKYVH